MREMSPGRNPPNERMDEGDHHYCIVDQTNLDAAVSNRTADGVVWRGVVVSEGK